MGISRSTKIAILVGAVIGLIVVLPPVIDKYIGEPDIITVQLGQYPFSIDQRKYRFVMIDEEDGVYGVQGKDKAVTTTFQLLYKPYDLETGSYDDFMSTLRSTDYLFDPTAAGVYANKADAYELIIEKYTEDGDANQKSFSEYDILIVPKSENDIYMYRFNFVYGNGYEIKKDLYEDAIKTITLITKDQERPYNAIREELRLLYEKHGNFGET